MRTPAALYGDARYRGSDLSRFGTLALIDREEPHKEDRGREAGRPTLSPGLGHQSNRPDGIATHANYPYGVVSSYDSMETNPRCIAGQYN